MSLPVAYLPEARDDIDAAYATYEARRSGLGAAFVQAVEDRVGQIQANPALYGLVNGDVRAAPMRRFPFVIYYRVEPTQIVILAVLHGRQSSSHWQTRE
jgi:plasmid stabilization system protein ParE